MKNSSKIEVPWNERWFDDGVEWVAARQPKPMQDKLQHLRAYDKTLIEVIEP